MNATAQLHDLGQNRRLDKMTGGLRSSQTHGLYFGDLAVTARSAANQIGWQGESL
jgi:hypothetical protein